MSLPELPRQVSPDGREIWDWAAKFSEHVHRQDAIRQLRFDIAGIGRRCGDCSKWMKSRECPKERNVNGRNHGPSMSDLKCSGFVEDRTSTRRREELQAKLDALTSEQPK